jgi:rhodanese-related sulfurtransferase
MTQPIKHIEVEELQKMLQNSNPPVLLDVREDKELAICKIPGAMHLPLGQLPQRFSELPRDIPIVINCHHGGRSARACAWLIENGYSNVTNLAGGIHAWAERIDQSMEQY